MPQVDPTAIVDPGVTLGEGTKIWHWSHVCSGAIIGKNCTLGQNVYIGPNVRIGDNTKIQNNCYIPEGVTLGNGVFLGPSVVFTNDKYPPSHRSQWLPIVVADEATLGANTTVVCGIKIGKRAFIGAGSVVTKDIPDLHLAYGNPVKIQKKKKVSFICSQDWANVSTCIAKAINEASVRLEARSFCLWEHPFKYALKHHFDLLANPSCIPEARKWLNESEIMVLADEQGINLTQIPDYYKILGINIMDKPNRFIFQAGFNVRAASKNIGDRDNAMFKKQLLAPDLYRLGGSNRHPLLWHPIDIPSTGYQEKIQEKFQQDKIIITHTPSNREVKGSDLIAKVVNSIRNSYPAMEYREIPRSDNPEIIRQKEQAHIHIDQINDLGGIGISAVEGLWCGNIVIVSGQHIHDSVYDVWGSTVPPFVKVGNSPRILQKELIAICRMTPEQRAERAIAGYEWILENLNSKTFVNLLETRVFDIH